MGCENQAALRAKALVDLDVLRGAQAPLFHVTMRIFRSSAGAALLHRYVRDLDLGKLMVPLRGDSFESEPKSFALART